MIPAILQASNPANTPPNRGIYKFVSTNKARPCPICGKTNGSCSTAHHKKTGQIRYFCISYPHGGAPVGYRFLWSTRDNTWGIYADDSDHWQKYPSNSFGFGFLAKPKRNVSLSERQSRDAYFDWLMKRSNLALTEQDRKILIDKGLKDEEISGEIFASLDCGILILFRDVYGYRIAAQIRSRNPNDGYRYVWYKNKKLEPRLPDGQMPIAVWKSGNLENNTVCMCEGYLKSYIARQQFLRMGQDRTWVGFGSVGYLSSGFLEISRTIKELKPKEIIFYPDSNSANNENVAEKYLTFWKDITQAFPDIKLTVASWQHEFGKSEDIDEVDKSRINLFSYKEYISYFQGIKTYPKEERLSIWQKACESHKYILDSSPTGTGKSYDSGRWAGEAIYICNNHRNPTVETLTANNGWRDVEARHGGLFVDNFNCLRRISENQIGKVEVYRESNCQKHEIHQKLRENGYNSLKVCYKCDLFQECKDRVGEGFGYLHQRSYGLMSEKIRIHPDSLPSCEKYDYQNKTVFIEEAGDISLVSELKASVYQLDECLAKVDSLSLSEQEKEEIKSYIEGLKKAINKQRGQRYGILNTLKAPQISGTAQLSLFNEFEKGVDEIIEPDAVADEEWQKASKSDRFHLFRINEILMQKTSEPEYIVKEIEKAINPALVWLLQGCNSWINNDGTISVFRPKSHIQEVIKAAKNVIFLDATANREKIALMYGLEPQNIYQISAEKVEEKNLQILQIRDLGKLCQQRGADQQRRLNLIIERLQEEHPGKTRTIDLKRFAEDGCWWRDSRGRNEFEECEQLILIGTPARNWGKSLCSYLALGGNPNLFERFYNGQIAEDLIQGIGRIRAQSRPGVPLKVILITNFEIGNYVGLNIQNLKSGDVCPDAAPKVERTVNNIAKTFLSLKNQNIKATQKSIAETLKLARKTVNCLWHLVLQRLAEMKGEIKFQLKPKENLEEWVEKYAKSMLKLYRRLSCKPKERDRQIINFLRRFYNPENPYLCRRIVLKFEELYINFSGQPPPLDP